MAVRIGKLSLMFLLFISVYGCAVGTRQFSTLTGFEKVSIFGGYEPGNIIGINKKTLEPEIRFTSHWLSSKGLDLSTTEPDPLNNYKIDKTDEFIFNLSGGTITSFATASAKAIAEDIDIVELMIENGERYWLKQGEGHVLEWLYKLDPESKEDQVVIDSLIARSSPHIYPQQRLIVEIIKVYRGKYVYHWKKAFNAEAQANFAKENSGLGKINWKNDRNAEITIEKPLITGYKYFNIPLAYLYALASHIDNKYGWPREKYIQVQQQAQQQR